jgi:murein DD-endopeptidase MepM/ murein hydrolase activator NlpD
MLGKQIINKYPKPIAFIIITMIVACMIFLWAVNSVSIKSIANSKASAKWVGLKVQHGDTLNEILKNSKLDYNESAELLLNPEAKRILSQLKVGHQLQINITPTHKLLALKYEINPDKYLLLTRQSNTFNTEIVYPALTEKFFVRSATISHSLRSAAHKAHLTTKMYDQLTQIFKGDIDYRRDIHPGDHFSILYREYFLHGHKYKPGNIIAASFTNQHKTYNAVRFTYPVDHTAYYTPDGHGMGELFLRAPLHYDHISSHFTYHRYDPVLHKIRPHLGIDYAANRGTPIYSIGNGRVIFDGKDDGYGNAVIIRYSKKYKVLYGHMEKFARHLHRGERVKRGQVIGYVGSTGWSTGPHLHFELYVNGTPRDPFKVKLPHTHSVPRSYLAQYRNYAHKMLTELHEDDPNS